MILGSQEDSSLLTEAGWLAKALQAQILLCYILTVTSDKFLVFLNPNFFTCKMVPILPRPPSKGVPSSRRCPAHRGPLINLITPPQSSVKVKDCGRWGPESAGASWNLIGGHQLGESRVSCYSWSWWNPARFQVPSGSPDPGSLAGHVSSELWPQHILPGPPHSPSWKEPWGTERVAGRPRPPEADLSLLTMFISISLVPRRVLFGKSPRDFKEFLTSEWQP